jgi:hypothetical protein
VEIAAGADEGGSFVRDVTDDSLRLSQDQLTVWPKSLLAAITEAMSKAAKLSRHDLKDRYFRSPRESNPN